MKAWWEYSEEARRPTYQDWAHGFVTGVASG